MFKLIGIFTENGNGEEVNELGELIDRHDLIGSLSADAGDIELYYDKVGNTYAVAKDSEYYYGINGKTVPTIERDKLESYSKESLIDIVRKYDRYIKDANEDDRYKDSWYPVCVDEFIDNEYQEAIKEK